MSVFFTAWSSPSFLIRMSIEIGATVWKVWTAAVARPRPRRSIPYHPPAPATHTPSPTNTHVSRRPRVLTEGEYSIGSVAVVVVMIKNPTVTSARRERRAPHGSETAGAGKVAGGHDAPVPRRAIRERPNLAFPVLWTGTPPAGQIQ